MTAFSLNHLSDVEFEEFCYDLLCELGFVNLNWRKGTGLSSSPSDSGRDIECQREVTEIDGNKYLEKWFVECKHYEKGIPPDKVQGALAWATAEKPDVLLIIASNFLSNPTKDYLRKYQENNAPRFKIKVWEKTDLERLSSAKSRILRKYKIAEDFPFLSILHPAHVLYIQKPSFNTLNYFFELLDTLNPKRRDAVLGWIYEFIIKPRYEVHTVEMLGRQVEIPGKPIDEVSYEAFKKSCYQLRGIIDEVLLVFLIVSFVLQFSFSVSDITSVGEKLSANERTYEYLRKQAKEEPDKKDEIERMISTTQRLFEGLPERTKRNYEDYEYICEHIVTQLFLEEFELTRRQFGSPPKI